MIGKIRGSELLKNAAQLLSANIVAQTVGLLVYPLLSRLFDAEEFGLLNLFLSIGSVAVLFATCEYHYAIVLPRSDRQARWCVGYSLRVCACVVALLLLPCVVLRCWVAEVFDAPPLADYLWLMPLYVGLTGLWNVANYWYLRQSSYKMISLYQVCQSLSNAVMKVAGGVAHVAGTLLYATVLAPLISLVTVLMRCGLPKVSLWRDGDERGIRMAGRRYCRFPFFSLPKSVLEALSCNLIAMVLAPSFGLGVVGLVGMALTLAYRPINIICSSLNQVYYRQSVQDLHAGMPLVQLLRRHVVVVMCVAVPLFAVLWCCLPGLCAWLLGDGWRQCGEYIRLMLPWLLTVLLATPLNYMPDIFDKQHGRLLWLVARLVLQVVSLVVGICMGDVMLTVGLYFGCGAATLVGELLWYFRLSTAVR